MNPSTLEPGPLPPCLHLAETILPRVRAAAAHRLVESGESQARVAHRLGVSQPMVSRYLAGGRAERDPLVLQLAEALVQGQPARAADGVHPWCQVLGRADAGDESRRAVQDVLAAQGRLLEANPVPIVPAIGINLARALPGATAEPQVLSFPGRIVEAAGRLVSPAPPAWGGSGHLARCLLRAHARDASTLAAISIRGGPEASDAARRLGLKPHTVRRGRTRRIDVERPVLRAIGRARVPIRAVHDPGAWGVEPCLYLFGADAATVAGQALALAAKMPDT